jgi:uncharacterized RDD family membrane protein YckC
MSEFNPYAPPQTDPIADLSSSLEAPLASPWIRLGAQLLDTVVGLVVNLPLMYFSGYFARTVEHARNGQQLVPETFLWGAVGFALFVAINWVFLQNGQTIGKKLVKIQIVKKDGSSIPATAIILRRLLPVQAVALIPFIGGVLVCVDGLMIFRAKRNTLHDDIADTKVVQLQEK